jgi:hypothetical protein
MNEPTASILRENSFLTVVFDDKPLTIHASASGAFKQAVDAFKKQDWEALKIILVPERHIAKVTEKFEDVEVREGKVFYLGDQVNGVIAERIIQFRNDGADMLPLMKFLAKLMLNPSKRAVDELYTFLEHKNLPVTTNGNFLAYKGVTSDYWSISSGSARLLQGQSNGRGQIFNGVGEVIQIPRNQVDDNKSVGCSYGLHAGSLKYADEFKGSDGRLVIVEIDPSDVVSIPTDCSCQKLRTARYKVVGEYKGKLSDLVYKSNMTTENDKIIDKKFGTESKFKDADGNPMVDGAVYTDERRTGVYLWRGTGIEDSPIFELLRDDVPTTLYNFNQVSDPYLLDEELRVDYDGAYLIDGEIYESDFGGMYQWCEDSDEFIATGGDSDEVLTYLQSITHCMSIA